MFNKTFIITLLGLFLWSCGSVAKTQHESLRKIPFALLGKFTDDYGSNYTITNSLWMHGTQAKYHLLIYDEIENYFIAQNDKANPSDVGLYTRIDIVYFENTEPWTWGYCYTAYKAKTLQEAINTLAADKKNPRKGCNGYPFSRMKKD